MYRPPDWSAAYDSAILEGSRSDKSGKPLFFDLALEDITVAADFFRATHDQTNGVDGWVSLEVPPSLADDLQIPSQRQKTSDEHERQLLVNSHTRERP